jgi:O-antigen/teichoic acid export membrane protein
MKGDFVKLINKFFDLLLSGDSRMAKAKKNILGSALIKGFSILISLVLVPLTLGYLNSYEYGVWLTLSSILMWINFFDIGLGNGLRNRLAEAIAIGDYKLGQIYVSTTAFILSVLMILIYAIFFVLQYWINWGNILNVTPNTISDLNTLIIIVFAFFCLSFVFKFIGNVYLANQLPMVNDLLSLLSNLLSLIIIYLLTLYTKGDLKKVAIAYSLAPVLIYLMAYPITFSYKYKHLRPTFRSVKIQYAKDLMGLGLQFFIIQIACLIIFTTSNILISQLFGPEQVTPYNIAFK